MLVLDAKFCVKIRGKEQIRMESLAISPLILLVVFAFCKLGINIIRNNDKTKKSKQKPIHSDKKESKLK